MSCIDVQGLSKRFNRRTIFKEVSFKVSIGEVFAVTGRNGSGKSTLVKILAGLLGPTKGDIAYTHGNNPLESQHLYRHLGLVAPYLRLYEEFSARENLKFFCSIRGIPFDVSAMNELLERLNLPTDRNDPIAAYSSGMMQRMRFAFALLHDPAFLLLDEPTSNLDDDGKSTVYDIVRESRESRCIMIATNDAEDFALCDKHYSVDGTVPMFVQSEAG